MIVLPHVLWVILILVTQRGSGKTQSMLLKEQQMSGY